MAKRFSAYGSQDYKTLSNMVGEEHVTPQDMLIRLERVKQDKLQVGIICKREIEAMMEMGADITQMSFHSKSTTQPRVCKTPAEMRWSLCLEPTERNMKRVHWIFHWLPWKTHQEITLKGESHQQLVVKKVLEELNLEMRDEGPTNHKKGTAYNKCIPKL